MLAAKAVNAYEETLDLATKAGLSDARFLDEAQASLARLRAAAAADAR